LFVFGPPPEDLIPGAPHRGIAGARRASWTATLMGLSALAIGVFAADRALPDQLKSTEIVGTTIQVSLQSGKVLRTPDLVGAMLDLDIAGIGPTAVRIDSVRPDPRDESGEILLYHMSTRDGGTGNWIPACDLDPDGNSDGFPLQGKWDNTGHRVSAEGLTLACTSGALAKCVRFGYKPWKTLADGTALSRYHEACVHMVRADYCGNDSATTRNGTPIDVFDDIGIEKPEMQQVFPFEAAWDEHGAVCVAHTRIPANIRLEQLALRCPRLAAHLGERACTVEAARKFGNPLVFNRSR
jgi:hypothetical protein